MADVSRWIRRLSLLGALTVVCSCDDARPVDGAADSGPSGDGAEAPSAPNRLPTLARAELTRDLTLIEDGDVSHRDPSVRRAAARALARLRDPAARERLLGLLSDEDDEVTAWAAYGLGDVCAGAREEIVEALATTAAARAATPATEEARVEPQRAVTRAVGRCGTDKAEQLLASWATQRDRYAVDAVYALGDIARQNKRLREETYVALLHLAEGTAAHKPMPVAFYPLGRAEYLRTPSVIEQAQKVAQAALAEAGPARIFAIRALGRCDEQAVPALLQVLESSDYTPAERGEAARNLARFGRAGQDALADGLAKLTEHTEPELLSTSYTSLILVVLGELTVFRGARKSLELLAALPPPADASVPLLRRLSWIRCAAARQVAERDFKQPLLRGCDLLVPPDTKRADDPLLSSIGARAIVTAIGVDAAKITGERLAAWRSYALGGDLRARQDALRLIGQHGEIPDVPAVLTKALQAHEPGLVATAAEVIGAHPSRVQVDGVVNPSVAEALVAGLDGQGPGADLEVLGAVIEAVGRLRLEPAKTRLVEHCRSPYGHVRKLAETALGAIMGKDSPRCEGGPALAVPVELERLPEQPVTVELQTDVGKLELVLDPSLAPVAAARAVDLAKNGFYDGMVVHRVVLGFVTQFGSPTSDGYGGVKGLPSLPCETSPIHFGAGAVGVALAGRDTGSSQLFVTHMAAPHLDGEYAQIGTATGPWDALVDGDVIQRASVVSK